MIKCNNTFLNLFWKFKYICIIYNFNLIVGLYKYLAFEQPNNHLYDIGLKSGSTVANMLYIILLFYGVILIHIIFLLSYRKWRGQNSERRWTKIWKMLMKFFVFSIYIRYIILAFLTIWLSSFGEVNGFKIGNGIEITSFIINIFIFILIFVFCGMSFWQIIRAYTSLKSKMKYDFTEYFVGLKSKTTSRLYIFMFLSIRILSWFIVAMLPNINLTMKVFALTILQATSATYLLAVRPYEYVINTISESINQICISFWICVLIYFNTLERWSLFINWMLILIIIFSIAIQVLISLIYLFIQIVKRLKRCFWESKKQKEVKENNDLSSLQNESDISGLNPTSINLQTVKEKYNEKSPNT